jgi:hypothetical protein
MGSGSNVSVAHGEESLCVFSGIDGATGEYLQSPLSVRQLADLARREPHYRPPDGGAGVPAHRRSKREPGEGIDPRDLGQTGWGVIFAGPEDAEIRAALSPLLAHRRAQASREKASRYREMRVRSGESKAEFLARHGAAPGPAQPDYLPYYLLLVGDPEQLPFEFQYQLDVQYAVGRIHFDSPEEYARYARSVVAAENGQARRQRAAAFFGPRNEGDALTGLSCDQLAASLAKSLADRLPDWTIRTSLGDQATKGGLTSILEGSGAPALLFTAGHGLCFPANDERQVPLQGSLVCQEWPGPGHPVDEGQYFSAGDVGEDAQIAGLIAFHFSCYGAGTPRRDGFQVPVFGEREIARRAFLSRLSSRLLAHPRGGALAVIGHVDRAWSWSFAGLTGREVALRPVFESTLCRLFSGAPLGYAMEFFNGCYAELASDLDEELRRDCRNHDYLARLWANRNDARNYAVLGDPAVRLALPPES